MSSKGGGRHNNVKPVHRKVCIRTGKLAIMQGYGKFNAL